MPETRHFDIIKVVKMTILGNELKGYNSIRPARSKATTLPIGSKLFCFRQGRERLFFIIFI